MKSHWRCSMNVPRRLLPFAPMFVLSVIGTPVRLTAAGGGAFRKVHMKTGRKCCLVMASAALWLAADSARAQTVDLGTLPGGTLSSGVGHQRKRRRGRSQRRRFRLRQAVYCSHPRPERLADGGPRNIRRVYTGGRMVDHVDGHQQPLPPGRARPQPSEPDPPVCLDREAREGGARYARRPCRRDTVACK